MLRKFSKPAKLPNNNADDIVEINDSLDDDDDDANHTQGDGDEGSEIDDDENEDGSKDDSEEDSEDDGIQVQGSNFVDNVSLQVLYVQFFISF